MSPRETASPMRERVEDLERQLILEALDAEGGVKVRAAQRLGITERILTYKMKKYRIGKTWVSEFTEEGGKEDRGSRATG